MLWTLAAFLITLAILRKLAFPRIQEALDRRANAIEESIEHAERMRREADDLLDEYRARLREARQQAEEIVARARKAAENLEREGTEEALHQVVEGADETVVNFVELLLEKHRMPVIFRIRARYDELWERENRLLPVPVTSAVELDEGIVEQIGERIGSQTGQRVELTSRVDPDILGGVVVRVGNAILDASIRHRLERLRKQVARA